MTTPEKMANIPDSVLILADCHIRKRTWSNFAKISDDAYVALSTIIQEINPLPETLLIAGDWFDTDRPSTTDILKSAEFFANFRTVLYIAGNHDRRCGEVFTALQETSKNLTGSTAFIDISQTPYISTVRGHTIVFAGLPYIHDQEQFIAAYTEKVLAIKNDYPDAELTLVIHASYKHLLGFEGAYHIDLEQTKNIASDYPVTVIVGHVHVRDTRKYADNDRAYVHSPGSLYPSTFAQALDRNSVPTASVYHLADGDITDEEIPVRAYADLNFVDYADLETKLYEIVNHARQMEYKLPSLVRLHVTADMMNSAISVPADIADDIVLHITTATTDEPEAEVTITEGYSMVEAVKEALAAYGEDAEQLSEYAEALLTSDDALGTIEEWLEFWGVMRTYVTKGVKNVKTDQTLSK